MESEKVISKELAAAREFEEKEEKQITESMRPVYHFSPRTGWLNDPNGLSYYDGRYHLFYQYHPYSSFWGPMHWGHAVSHDLITWEYMPAALAPDSEYDMSGCFSGSAMVMDDGSHLLMYTSCGDSSNDPTGKGRWIQSQSVAVMRPDDSPEYTKHVNNPVITAGDLPDGGDPYEFRDPFMWRAADGSFRVVVANGRTTDEEGTRLLMYRSEDGIRWEGCKVLFEDERRIGIMWECPNFFPLGGRQILIASPMDMQAEEGEAVGSIRFPQGNNVCYITGEYDEETEVFTPDSDDSDAGYYIYEPVDGGLDFYAPQVLETPDGRRVMIGWMQDPSMANLHSDQDFRIFGQMTVPRELSLEEGKLYQRPVRELEKYRTGKVSYEAAEVCGDLRLDGISGRSADIEIDIRPSAEKGLNNDECSYRSFSVKFAADSEHFTEVNYDPVRSVITVDRSNSGISDNITRKRSIKVCGRGGSISLRLLIDRWSAELFINDGEQVISMTYYTSPDASDVIFSADGKAVIDVTKYEIRHQ